eukprot:gene29-40_t
MTDFVAVIRRAVDGLKDNNPDMRAKVYEKARSAVLKQLENMKPRPSDDVIARQMAKLDAAAISVENEHSAALPADTDLSDQQSVAPERFEPVPVPPRAPEPKAPNFDNYITKSNPAPASEFNPSQALGSLTTQQPPVIAPWSPPASPAAPAQPADVLWVPEDADPGKTPSPMAPSPARDGSA